jgi:hypothetical protein
MHKMVFFVPGESKEEVKAALFAAGAGRFRAYDRCCWEVAGTGQFRPLEGADPFIGSVGAVEHVPEYRVEMICRDELVPAALAALITAHPYEEPAYEVYPIYTRDDYSESM